MFISHHKCPQFAGKNHALIASTTKIIEDQPQQWSAVVKNLGLPATPQR
jgi:hypothetical protein